MIGLADAKSRRPLHAFVQDEGEVIITIDEDEDSENDEVDDMVSN